MKRMIWVLAGAAAVLSSCGKSQDGASSAPMTREEVARKVDAIHLKPGQWEMSFTVDDLDMTGLPGGAPSSAQMKEQMKESLGKTAIRHCVTPEQAARPSGDMFAGEQAKGCTYSGFRMEGGAMQGTINCKREGSNMTSTMSGHYASDSYDVAMDSQMTGGPNGMNMKMKARTKGKWVGPTCS